jgi:hypothetical protein
MTAHRHVPSASEGNVERYDVCLRCGREIVRIPAEANRAEHWRLSKRAMRGYR